jgi:hypothetical protein
LISGSLVAASALPAVSIVPMAHGQGIISYNEDAYGTFATSGTAGVVPAINWNDSYTLNNGQTGNDTFTNLLNNAGIATTVNLTTTAFGLYQIQGSDPGLDANGTNNKRLINGYLNAGSSVGTTTSAFAITNIPFLSYNIIVYFSSDTAGRAGTVSNGSTTYDFSSLGPSEISGGSALFTQTTDTGGANPGADYAIFTGLSGGSQTITANVPSFGGLAGFQIVSVPEPSSWALVIAGVAGLVLYRRQRRFNCQGAFS